MCTRCALSQDVSLFAIRMQITIKLSSKVYGILPFTFIIMKLSLPTLLIAIGGANAQESPR